MPEHDKSKEVYDYAVKMARNYVEPRDIVDFISNTKHNGYDASYERDMIAAFYNDGCVIYSSDGNSVNHFSKTEEK